MAGMRKTIYWWLFFLSVTVTQAQKLRFRHVTPEDGLSTGFVKAILQGDRGFMWFGTQDGLNRYDGYQIRVYKKDAADPGSIVNADVTCLLQPAPGLMLVGSREGLDLFDLATERFVHAGLPAETKGARVNALLDLDTGTVLVATDEGLALFSLRSGTATLLSFNGVTRMQVKCLGRVDGAAYAGTAGSGLWRLGSNGAMQRVELTNPDLIPAKEHDLEHVTCIRQYGSKMYLGTEGAGIFKIDRSLEIQSHISFSALNPKSDFIRDFLILNNTLYAATGFGAITHHLISGANVHYTRQENAESLNSNPCNCIFADRNNNIWIGTDLGGVNVAMNRSLRFPVSPYNFESVYDNIYAFSASAPDRFLAGGISSLVDLDLEKGAVTDLSALLGEGTARCLYEENANVLWIGTWGNGVYRYDRTTRRTENLLSDIGGGTVLSFHARNGFLYAASAGDGLFRIDLRTRAVVRFGEEHGLPGLNINCIFGDSKGRLWLGTYDRGLVALRPDEEADTIFVERIYRHGGKGGDIASNVIFGVNEAANGAIWAATSSGLSKLLPDHTFRNFGRREGLPNTYLHTLQRDSTGQFWASSNAGLIRFDPALAHESITFKSYGLKDGLLNTTYHPGAAFSATSGLMYFGGPKGFNVFRPTTIKDNLNPPPVLIVGYTSGGREVSTDTLITYKKHLQLDWSHNSFQFELAALDFTEPQKNLFSYKLEGYDREWSAPSSVRYAAYTELPGGDYVFKVKAANNDGIWNDQVLELSISVVPPFWNSTFFYVLMVMTAIAVVYGFTYLRMRSIKRENMVLETKVAHRTRELEARNRDITSSIEYAKRIQEAILPATDQIFRKLKKVFILYQPKDIVSGDFYWFAEKDGVKIFAVVDCTGHGVPGALMSMIGHNLLDQVVTETGITDPGDILNHLHRGVLQALRQGHNEASTNDGMDVSVIAINDASREVRWAGANRPLVIIDANGEFMRYDGNKDPVGGAQAHLDRLFTTHVIKVEVAAMAYLFTDGYADQFGGERGKKFMVRRFHELLLTIHTHHPDEQKAALEAHFQSWRQNHEQVDDVLIVGIEI